MAAHQGRVGQAGKEQQATVVALAGASGRVLSPPLFLMLLPWHSEDELAHVGTTFSFEIEPLLLWHVRVSGSEQSEKRFIVVAQRPLGGPRPFG